MLFHLINHVVVHNGYPLTHPPLHPPWHNVDLLRVQTVALKPSIDHLYMQTNISHSYKWYQRTTLLIWVLKLKYHYHQWERIFLGQWSYRASVEGSHPSWNRIMTQINFIDTKNKYITMKKTKLNKVQYLILASLAERIQSETKKINMVPPRGRRTPNFRRNGNCKSDSTEIPQTNLWRISITVTT